jgi:hypothetical protein
MPATPTSKILSTWLPMISAVTEASSATAMSDVPAVTTAITPRPRIVLSRRTEIAPQDS